MSQSESLENRVERLEGELAEEREQRRRLERVVAMLERDMNDWRRDHEKRHEATSNWNDAIEDRVAQLEDREVDLKPQDVITAGAEDSLIPIQQMYNACKNGAGDSLSKNKRLAAQVWPHYRKYADPTNGTLTLRSPKVKDILRDELGITDPNPNTVRRVMEFLAKYSGEEDSQFIEFDTDGKVNKLECGRQDWKDVTGEMLQAAQQSSRSAVATDGGETTR